MNSCLYFGEILHARYRPKKHRFKQKLFMTHLFLDESDLVFGCHPLWSTNRRNLAYFNRSDYHGDPKIPLKDELRKTCSQQLGINHNGKISMLTHLRYFGHCFNPVTFYYFWNKELTLPDIILAEINNTPWDERYSRAFKWTSSNLEKTTHKFDKEFHVSPFMPMEIGYIWEFGNPGKKLSVHMINEDDQGKTFEASMNLSRKPINFFNLTFALVRFPLITISILLSIYFNAMLLKMKGCSFYPHPDSKSN